MNWRVSLFMVTADSSLCAHLTRGYLQEANLEWKQIVVKNEEILLENKCVAESHQIGVLE